MMFNAKIVIRLSAPPENRLNMSRMPPGLLAENVLQDHRIDAGNRDIGAEPVDDQSAQGKPEALFQFRRLRKGAEIQIGCELFSG